MKTVLVLGTLVAVAFIGTISFVYLGIYNIGADSPHWKPTHKVIGIFRERAVAAHARGIKVPTLDDPAMIAEGAEHYGAMCVQCHLAPGMENTELREGLYPLPPNLAEHKHDETDHGDDAARQFWIIKHGIKMTGMPAAGKNHDDKTIWGMVAFLRKLPGMTTEEYSSLTAGTGGHDHGDTKGGTSDSPKQADEHHHDHVESSPAPEQVHEPPSNAPN